MEEIICRTCGTTILIARKTTCPGCKEEVFTKQELMHLIKEKQNQANTLQAEIAMARTELFYRSKRQGKPYFWENMRPALALAKGNMKREKEEKLPTISDDILAML